MKKLLNALLVMFILTIVSACSSGSLLDQYEDAKTRSDQIIDFIERSYTDLEISQEGEVVLDEDSLDNMPLLIIPYELNDSSTFSMIFYVSNNGETSLAGIEFKNLRLSEELQKVLLAATEINDFEIDESKIANIASNFDYLTKDTTVIDNALFVNEDGYTSMIVINDNLINSYPDLQQKADNIVTFMNERCPDYELNLIGYHIYDMESEEIGTYTKITFFCNTNEEGQSFEIDFSDYDEKDNFKFESVYIVSDSFSKNYMNLCLCATYIEDFNIDFNNSETTSRIAETLSNVIEPIAIFGDDNVSIISSYNELIVSTRISKK